MWNGFVTLTMKLRRRSIVILLTCIGVYVIFFDWSSRAGESIGSQLKSNSAMLRDPITIYSPSKNNSTVAVCLLVKNETLYIDEWMDFHISLGFKVYLYDNTLTDDLDLRRWYNTRKDIQEHVKIIHFPQRPAQNAAYKQVSPTLLHFLPRLWLKVKEQVLTYYNAPLDLGIGTQSSVSNMMRETKHSLL